MVLDKTDVTSRSQHNHLKRLGKLYGKRVARDKTDLAREVHALSSIGTIFPDLFALPADLILPSKASSTPTGFAAYTTSDGYYPVGSGSLFSAGTTYDDTVTFTTNSTEGTHGSTVYNANTGTSLASYYQSSPVSINAGSHAHSCSLGAWYPPYQALKFIMHTGTLKTIPADVLVLGAIDMTVAPYSLTNNYTDGLLLHSASSVATGGANTSLSPTVSTTGSHGHGNYATLLPTTQESSGSLRNIAAGDHTHTIAVTMTDALKKVCLAAYTGAAEFCLRPKMIGFMSGLTTPDGWIRCDGTKETVNTLDRFVKLVSKSSAELGTVTGSGSSTAAITSCTSEGAHEHRSGELSYGAPPTTYTHGGSHAAHSHSLAPTMTGNKRPSVHGLSFIMFMPY
jgi:hypothetical protein